MTRVGKRWLFTLVILVGLALILTAAACGGSGPTPTPAVQGSARIAFDVEEVDLGRVPLNKEVEQVFRLRNVGDQPLTIQNVNVGVLEGC